MSTSPLPVSPVDERPHQPSPDPRWSEWWDLEACQPDGSSGVVVRIGLHPSLGVATYLAGVVGAGRAPVVVVDDDVPLPRRHGSLEVRSSGLWADHNCEVPLEHWSVGLEAFGLALDDEALDQLDLDPGRPGSALVGERTPVGFDLEWEAAGPVSRWPAAPPRSSAGPNPVAGYDLACRVHGEVLVGHEVIEVDGVGRRGHGWGLGAVPGAGPPGPTTAALHRPDGTCQVGAAPATLVPVAVLPQPAAPRVGRPAWWRTLVVEPPRSPRPAGVGWVGGARPLSARR